MKRLNDEEIKQLSNLMGMPADRVKSYADILFSEKQKGSILLEGTALGTVDDYYREREDNWYFYPTWEKLVESEAECGAFGLTESECRERIGAEIFQLIDGYYAQTVY